LTGWVRAAYFVNLNLGWAVGDVGQIYNTTDGGLTFTTNGNNKIPSDFMLHQNFPNPFNPSTNIKFEIPKSSYVKLNIYDINGRLLEYLINEEMNPGVYEVIWNASNYSSGIYFYRFETENYTETKRMTLIK